MAPFQPATRRTTGPRVLKHKPVPSGRKRAPALLNKNKISTLNGTLSSHQTLHTFSQESVLTSCNAPTHGNAAGQMFAEKLLNNQFLCCCFCSENQPLKSKHRTHTASSAFQHLHVTSFFPPPDYEMITTPDPTKQSEEN